ncbi:hypothetical protein B566_EDAN016673 [Ephemera danica]|nr:hypothetical protein B566_EDAN016673 [Ephemera danica]
MRKARAAGLNAVETWLLRYDGIKVRTSDPIFLNHVQTYFNQLLPLIENEYGSFGPSNEPRDTQYLEFIRELYRMNGLNELYFTSDSATGSGAIGALPGDRKRVWQFRTIKRAT